MHIETPVPTEARKTAVVFIGNAGAGKSTLLTQIGGNFESGAKFRNGFTKDVTVTQVTLDEEEVVLIDVPGLSDPNPRNNQSNAEKLTEALTRNYNYKLFFVLKANNSGLEDADIQMMATVNACVRDVDDSKVTFGVFINQILERRVYDMYEKLAVQGNLQEFLSSLRVNRSAINIKIDKVTLLWFTEHGIKDNVLKEEITKQVKSREAVQLDCKLRIAPMKIKKIKKVKPKTQIQGLVSQLVQTNISDTNPDGSSARAFLTNANANSELNRVIAGYMETS